MGIDIRLPNITASTEREQLVQMKSYLFQLAEQLQWALQNVDTSNNTVAVSPTPKSLPSSSQNTASPEATFGSIKALIIKSADIVEAYYEKINLLYLQSQYLAASDFGVYKEQTTQEIQASSTDILTTFTNIQEVQYGALTDEIGKVNSKVGEVESNLLGDIDSLTEEIGATTTYLKDVKATIKAGELYRKNEVPVYGLEVGQVVTEEGVETFKQFARFTANRLSFYDEYGYEVAYISDERLNIEKAEIKGIFQIGGLETTALENGDVVEKWAGRR